MTNYQRFTKEEWEKVVSASKDDFVKSLGGKPTKREVSNKIPDTHQLDALTRIAILMLMVVSTFGVFKLGLTSYPLAENLVESNLHIPLPPVVKTLFQISVISSAALGGVYGMIYFKLVSESASTRRKLDMSRRMKKYEVGWWSPRLPIFLVFATISIMFIVSNTSNKTLFDWVFNNTIVLMELALSYPIAVWMSKRQARNEVVNQAYGEQLEEYETLVKTYETNPQYLRLLFQNASEAFFNLRAPNRTFPNRELRNEDTSKIEDIIADEFRRMNGGLGFSNKVITDSLVQSRNVEQQLQQVNFYSERGEGRETKGNNYNIITDKKHIGKLPESKNIYTENSHTLYNAGAGYSSDAPSGGENSDKRSASTAGRKPPNGDAWTADSLYSDLILSGAPKAINERYINDNYAGGYNARTVWRNYVRDQWGR